MTLVELIPDILIIVVLYRKKADESDSIRSILSSLPHERINLFIYDNSPEYNEKEPLPTKGGCIVSYTSDPGNSGVSRAYNTAAQFALKHNLKWLLLCDQDTVFNRGYFNEVLQAIDKNEAPLMAPFLFSESGLISPCGFIFNYGYHLGKIPSPGRNKLGSRSLLNSGLVISLESFLNTGGYNEKVFLDFSDSEFIKRYKRKYRNYYQLNACLNHNLESADSKAFNATRFRQYCKSITAAIHNVPDFISIGTIVLSRTVKQMFRHKTIEPLKCLYNTMVNK